MFTAFCMLLRQSPWLSVIFPGTSAALISGPADQAPIDVSKVKLKQEGDLYISVDAYLLLPCILKVTQCMAAHHVKSGHEPTFLFIISHVLPGVSVGTQ
jgi:hypothetical protein